MIKQDDFVMAEAEFEITMLVIIGGGGTGWLTQEIVCSKLFWAILLVAPVLCLRCRLVEGLQDMYV